jgi:hypothetical protein
LPVRLVRRSSISNIALLPLAHVHFERASRLHPADARKATPWTRRTEAHRDAGHLRVAARRAHGKSRLEPSLVRTFGLIRIEAGVPNFFKVCR